MDPLNTARGSPEDSSQEPEYTMTVLQDENAGMPGKYCPCKVYECGNVIEVHYSERVLNPPPVVRVSADWYVNPDTGEAFEYKHGEHFGADHESMMNSFANMRRKVNATVPDSGQCRFITLTYAHDLVPVRPDEVNPLEWDSIIVEDGEGHSEKKYFKKVPMTSTTRLYMDFKRFMTRFRRFNESNQWGKIGYIAAAEPQGNPAGDAAGPGSWHLHVIMFWEERKAPFLDPALVSSMWGQGFVNVRGLYNVELPNGKTGCVDNLGAYLTWYLSSDRIDKKANRLKWYPSNFHPFRYSRNCKEPNIYNTYANQLKKKVGPLGAPTFRKSYTVVKMHSDGHNEIYNRLTTEYYNKIR